MQDQVGSHYLFIAYSCLSHAVNIGTQELISTYSKSPHYSPHDLNAHEPDVSSTGDRDEIGLVQAICIKVCSVFSHVDYFVEWIERNVHQQNGRSFTGQFKPRQVC
jgi:hypothetical protein